MSNFLFRQLAHAAQWQRRAVVKIALAAVMGMGILWSMTLGDANAVTLLAPGTDISPTSTADLAATSLNILANWVVPIGGIGMLAAAGASFARNRASGISAGPASLGIGGAVLILAPAITSQLMTSAGAGAPFGPMVDVGQWSMSVNPILVASYLVTRSLRRS